MQKIQRSIERQELEKKISKLFRKSYRKALFWMIVGFPIMLFAKEWFLKFMGQRIKKDRLAWLKALNELEDLEKKQGFPAMRAYVDQLKELGQRLPRQLTSIGYYPFSGPDIYWGSIFSTLILEDSNFDTSEESHYSMWWDRKTYSLKKCLEIENTLRQIGLISTDTRINYLKGNSSENRSDNDFNNKGVTLVYKAGHPFAQFVGKRFKNRGLNFGAIIIAKDPTSQKKLDALLDAYGYKCIFHSREEEFLIPFALALKEKSLYVKI